MPTSFPEIENPGEDSLKTKWPRSAHALLCITMAVGIFLRLWNYFHNPPLWLDEASLSMNIVHRSFHGLLQKLDYDQAAPVGFLILVKAAITLLGAGERTLRLLPLLSGCALMLLAARVGRNTLGWPAASLFVAMLSVSQNLLKYSVQIKQYSSDAMIALVLLMTAMRFIRGRMTISGIVLWALLAAGSPWVSHPSVFVIGGTVAVAIIDRLRARRWGEASAAVIVGLLGAISFIASYLMFDRLVEKNAYLQYFWREGYMPTDSVGHAVMWCIHAIKSACGVPLGDTSFFLVLGGVLLGITALIRRGQFTLLGLLVSPGLLAFFAAMIHRYPFEWRLLCFLIPAAAYLCALGVDWLWAALPGRSRWFAPVLGIGTIAISAYKDAQTLKHPMVLHRIPPVLAHIAQHRGPDEPVCPVNMARSLYAYYAPQFDLPAGSEIISNRPEDVVELIHHLHGRLWLIVIKIDGKVSFADKQVFAEFEKRGRRIDHTQSTAVDGYEYELP